MIDTMPEKDHQIRTFARLRSEWGANGHSWLQPLRESAIARFSAMGFPTMKHEDWKYTNVAALAKTAFEPAPPGAAGLTAARLDSLVIGSNEGARLVFVNGRYSDALSRTAPLPGGVKVMSLSRAVETERARLEPHLARYAAFEERAFTALNTAFMSDGLFVDVPAGTQMAQPIHAVFVSAPQEAPSMSHPRNLVLAGAGCQITLIETYVSSETGSCLTNAVTEIRAEAGAVVHHHRIQRESEKAFHIGRVQARLERDSTFVSHIVTLGGALSRNEIDAVLDGEGADCTLNGLYVLSGRQHTDNHTTIDHAKPRGSSRELYKGVLDGNSRGVFDGKVIVRADAQKTDARQVNRNLLLADGALADTKPQLEIFADDVKCSHAATVGQLDKDVLFYLRSRGLDREAARSLLTHAFVSELLAAVKIEPLRAGLEALMRARLETASAGGGAS